MSRNAERCHDAVFPRRIKALRADRRGRVVGPARNWTCSFDLEVGDNTWQVHFDDWMIQQDDQVVINKATVSKFGFTLGEVTLFFKKPDDWEG